MTLTDRYITVTAPAGFEGYPTRRNHYFKTRNSAHEFRLRIKRWKAEQKSPSDTLSFDDNDKRWMAYLRAHVGNLEQLPEIVAHWNRTAKDIREIITVKELCRRYVLDRKSRVSNKGTLSEDRFVARRLASSTGAINAHEMHLSDVSAFLDTATGEAIRRKFYKIGSLIFKFARDNGHVILNCFDEIKRPKISYTTPGILTPEEFRQLLIAAQSKPDVLAFVAISGFAGLRRDELLKEYGSDSVLEWCDINFEKRLIKVRPEVAKKTTRRTGDRRFVPIEAALLEILTSLRREIGNVVTISDAAFRKQFRTICTAADVTPPKNSLRHSFASYWLARSEKEGLGRLATIMGNSEAVVRRHYLEVLGPEDGFAWFALPGAPLVASAGPQISSASARDDSLSLSKNAA